MATLLTKTIKRQLLAKDDRGRTLIMRLEPGDEVSFSIKGKRTRYTISLHSAYKLAIAQDMQNRYMQGLKDVKDGLRKRKPRAPSYNMFCAQIRAALTK